ncbi:hypothetical protein ACFL5U_02080 [Candidatus Margulisiibacteriota bacterium]
MSCAFSRNRQLRRDTWAHLNVHPEIIVRLIAEHHIFIYRMERLLGNRRATAGTIAEVIAKVKVEKKGFEPNEIRLIAAIIKNHAAGTGEILASLQSKDPGLTAAIRDELPSLPSPPATPS